MTAVLAGAFEPRPRWTPPLSPAAYDRRVALSQEERRALALIAGRPPRWPAGVAEALARLTAPVNDVLAVAGLKPGSWAGAPTRGELLAAMGRERSAFWAWDRPTWQRTVEIADVNVRQLVIAVAYHVPRSIRCGSVLAVLPPCSAPPPSEPRPVRASDTLGYAAQLRRPTSSAAVRADLAARSPVLDISPIR